MQAARRRVLADYSWAGRLRGFDSLLAPALAVGGGMIVRSRAPLRLGLAGGGTDVSPYCDEHGGAVLNVTIDLYAYTIIEPADDGRICAVASDLGQDWRARPATGWRTAPWCCTGRSIAASCGTSTAGGRCRAR